MPASADVARGASLLGGAALLLAGCTDGSDPMGPIPGTVEHAWVGLSDRPCPEQSFLDWESFGGPFILTWCAGCHNAEEGDRQDAPESIRFDRVEDVRGHLELVYLNAADDNDFMPPVGGPGLPERTLLGEWLACGAP